MQADANGASGTKCGQSRCSMAKIFFFQGDHDEKIILPTVKREVEDATPGRGKIQRSSVFLAFGVIVRNISLTQKLLVTI